MRQSDISKDTRDESIYNQYGSFQFRITQFPFAYAFVTGTRKYENHHVLHDDWCFQGDQEKTITLQRWSDHQGNHVCLIAAVVVEGYRPENCVSKAVRHFCVRQNVIDCWVMYLLIWLVSVALLRDARNDSTYWLPHAKSVTNFFACRVMLFFHENQLHDKNRKTTAQPFRLHSSRAHQTFLLTLQ